MEPVRATKLWNETYQVLRREILAMKPGNNRLPSEEELSRQLGGEVVTLGSDAHTARDVGCAMRERQALLKECGFTRYCTFEKMRPVWHAL